MIPATEEMLTFGISGGCVLPDKGTGYLFGLRLWAVNRDSLVTQQGTAASTPAPKSWTNLFQGGEGRNIRLKFAYDLEVIVQGSTVTAYINTVEVVKQNLPISALPGCQIGLFCGTHKKIRFRLVLVDVAEPKAFVVMQFETPEYEALFKDVIAPICKSEGLRLAARIQLFYPASLSLISKGR